MNKPTFIKNQIVELTNDGRKFLSDVGLLDFLPEFEGNLFIVAYVEVLENFDYKYHVVKFRDEKIKFPIFESQTHIFINFINKDKK